MGGASVPLIMTQCRAGAPEGIPQYKHYRESGIPLYPIILSSDVLMSDRNDVLLVKECITVRRPTAVLRPNSKSLTGGIKSTLAYRVKVDSGMGCPR